MSQSSSVAQATTTSGMPGKAHKRAGTSSTFVEEIADDVLFRSYRIGYSRTHTGRYIPSSKRRISWSFGLANLEAIKYGCTGNDCRGAENEVTLVWSVRSGKTRLWWNNQDVTHMVPRETGYTNASCDADLNNTTEAPAYPILYVQFSWQCGSGQMIRILAHANLPPSGRQYELFIDGQPFSSLPKISDLGSKEYRSKCLAKRKYALLDEFCRSERSYDGTNASVTSSRHRRFVEGEHARAGTSSSFRALDTRKDSSDSQLRDRLAAAGLSFRQDQDTEDELTMQSDYTNSLKMLRDDLVGTMPELEDMMSFAIINAFSEEDSGGEEEDRGLSRAKSRSKTSTRAVSASGMVIETPPSDPTGIEVDALCEAYDWMVWKTSSGPRREMIFHSEKVAFLQDKVTQMISHVRHGHLSALEASHIVQGVASMLDMELVSPLPKNTVILTKLLQDTTCSHVRRAMKEFGEINVVGVASNNRGFALCRFGSTREARLAIDAGFRHEIDIDDVRPHIFELHSPVYLPPASHVSTNDDEQQQQPVTVTPDVTLDENYDADDLSYINLPDPLQSSSHSCELPPTHSSGHTCDLTQCVTDLDESPMSSAIESPTSSPASNHHRKRSTAIFDGEPKTYDEDSREFRLQERSTSGIEVCLTQPTSSVCTLENPSFAEIYHQELDKANTPVHVLYVPEQA